MTGSLYGRGAELAVLRGLIQNAVTSGSALVVHGAPGVGKSALLNKLESSANERGMLVLRVTGVESESQMPFSGLHQILRPLMSRATDLPAAQREALSDVPGFAGTAPDVYLVALAALNLLSDASAEQPLVVVADDAHWLDTPTALVLSFIARRLDAERVVLVASYRDGFDSVFPTSDLPELLVEPLDAVAAAGLLDERSPQLKASVRGRLPEEAQGNPLALIELPVAWHLRGSEYAWSEPLPLTERLQRAFAARARDLPAVARSVLLVAALNDGESMAETLEATSLLDGTTDVLEGLSIAEGAHLISADGQTLRFEHPLIRSAIRETATVSQRHAAHAALRQTLAGEPDRAVWHASAIAVGPDEGLASQLEATAGRTRQRRGIAVALAALRRAAELSDAPAQRGDRLLSAAELALELGRQQEILALLDAAAVVDLAPRERRRILWLRGALAEASGEATLESMVSIARQFIDDGDTELALNALLSAAIIRHLLPGNEVQQELLASTADRLRVTADNSKLMAIYGLGAPQRRGSIVIEQGGKRTPVDLALANADGLGGVTDMHLYALSLTGVGEYGLAAAFQAAAIEGFRAHGRLGLLSRALGSHSVTGAVLGDWAMAAQAAEECLRLGLELGAGLAGPSTHRRELDEGAARTVLAIVAANRGEMEAADALIDEAERTLAPVKANFARAMVQRARTALALASGSYVEAFEQARRVFDASDPAHHPDIGSSRSLAMDFADAALLSGNAKYARAWLDSLRLPENFTERRATMTYVRAVLSDSDDEERFEEALEAYLTASAFAQARVRLAFGVWLRRQRRPAIARGHLRAAQEAFDAVGAVPWAERARQELRASGESARRRVPETRDALSPQELQIARYAAEGLTNREIGARLFLSHRTVGSHLYHIFPKLGIASRSELRQAIDRPAERTLQPPPDA